MIGVLVGILCLLAILLVAILSWEKWGKKFVADAKLKKALAAQARQEKDKEKARVMEMVKDLPNPYEEDTVKQYLVDVDNRIDSMISEMDGALSKRQKEFEAYSQSIRNKARAKSLGKVNRPPYNIPSVRYNPPKDQGPA